MNWKAVLLGLAMIGALSVAAPIVAADDGTPTEQEENESEADNGEISADYEYMFGQTGIKIVEDGWDGKTYIAEVEGGDRTETLTVSDSGRSADDGQHVEPAQETITIPANDTILIEFTIEEARQVGMHDGYEPLLTGYEDSSSTFDFQMPSVSEFATLLLGTATPLALILAMKKAGDRRQSKSPIRVF